MAFPSQEPPESSSGAAGTDLAQRVLGDYRLVRRLGQGAMADVYLAEQTSLRRQVALKILRPQLAGDATYVRRFELEARAAAALVDAHIVQIYEVGCVEGVHYIAQEYVAGQNLGQRLHSQGPLDCSLALRIMRQVAAALAKAAERGIVHRDIKPENIMLAHSGEVKVADFGLARLPGDAGSLALTQVGITLGTPLYMSPEQAEGRPLDSRSDLYSLGVTCYHMLAGQPPFRGDSPLAVAVQHLQAAPAPLEQIRPDLPLGLCRVVHRLLEKVPAARYATPRHLIRDLKLLAPLVAEGDQTAEEAEAGHLAIDELADAEDVAHTQALAALSQAMRWDGALLKRRWPLRRWALLGGAAVAAGALLAWFTRPGDPLAAMRGRPEAVLRQSTVYAQWLKALELRTEEGWLSVRQFFPDEEYYVRRADQQLARLYLQQDRLDEAQRLFDGFAAQGAEPEFQAFGLAGQAIIATLRSRHQESQRLLAELAPLREHLRGADLTRALLRCAEANRKALSQADADDFERWLEERFSAADG